MNPLLNFLEKKFTIFSLTFLTGLWRFQSLYSDPDPKSDGLSAHNPLDPLMSLLQYGIYAVAFFLIIARWKSSTRTALRDQLVWILAGTALISFLWSDFPDWSLKKGITTLQTTYFGLYMSSRFSLKQQLQMLAWALGIVAVLSLLFSLAFSGAAIEAGANEGAWRGPFVQKNILARLVVLGAIVFLLLTLDSPRPRYPLWGGLLLSVALILLTGSKTALLLFIIIVLVLPLYKSLRYRDTIVIPLIIAVILVTGSIAVLLIGNWENLLLGLGRDPTLSGRTDLWELAIEKIAERPWLGYGYQGFWQEGGGAEVIWKAEGYKPPHAHNGFVNISLDLGLVGLALFLLTIAITYIRSIAWLRSSKTAIELWPICYVTFFFMYNHSENTIIEHNSLFWTLLVAVSLSLKRIKSRESDQDEETEEHSEYIKITGHG
ncbi:O-antigen ligase family protein [Lyngbya aestuarii]|uniref:O-antigen ligase family protein n=1 Tax=Lyngbya aestuarii TaxID=118322 RepID=UPI00403DB214